MACVFISHSNRDQEQADKLLAWLRGQGFADTFLDFDKHGGIPPGADWERTLYRELTHSEAVLLVLTKNWFDSKWCFAEFIQARALGKAIFPLIEQPSGEMLVSPDIQHLDLIKDREGGLERLAAELTRMALNARGEFAWDGTRPPYPGMLSFDEKDAAVYFGRDDDIRRLIERLNARRAQGGARLVVVLGGSGSGKSSLVRAGIIPRLKRDPRNWLVLPPLRPQLHPLDELAQAICAGLGLSVSWQTCHDALAARDLIKSLSDVARELRAAHGVNEAQILIAIDQAEELFGVAEPADSQQFFKILDCLLDERLPFLAMMALRSDYLGELQRSTLSRAFEEFSLKPMPLERVRDIIEGPARLADLTIDNALTSAAIQDAVTDDALPLLAFTLRELYDRFGKSGHLTVEAYRALGDERAHLSPLENAVRQKAEEVWNEAKPTPETVEALKAAFVPAMVRVNPEGEYVRRPAAMNILPAGARPLLERLAKARLLVVRQEGDSTIVEVVHEALLRKWPLLRGWLDQERLFLIGKQQLEQDLRDWETAEAAQKNDALLSGLKLARARTWLVTHPLQLSLAERQFIEESLNLQARERAARKRQSTIAWAQHEAEIVKDQLEKQPIDCLIRAMRASLRCFESAGEEPPLSLQGALYEAVCVARERWWTSLHTASVRAVVFSPDGKTIASGSDDRSILLWDLQGQSIGTPRVGHEAGITALAFSPDGALLASAAYDGTVHFWPMSEGPKPQIVRIAPDVVTALCFSPRDGLIAGVSETGRLFLWSFGGHLRRPAVQAHAAFATACAFSPAADRLVTTAGDGSIGVWNYDGSRVTMRTAGHDGAVTSVAFSPDGQWIATGGLDKIVRLWTMELEPVGRPFEGHTRYVTSVAFSPKRYVIVSSSGDGTVRQWQTNGRMSESILVGHEGTVCSVAVSPDATALVSGGSDRTVRYWDYPGRQLRDPIDALPQPVNVVLFPVDDIILASCDDTIRRYSVAGETIGQPWTGHKGFIWAMDTSPSGDRVVSASGDQTLRLWDLTGRQIGELRGHTTDVTSVAFSSDGDIVSGSIDGSIHLWDSAGSPIRILGNHNGQVRVLDTLGAGSDLLILSGGNDRRLSLWDRKGQQIFSITAHDGPVDYAAFAPDGQSIISAGDALLRRWNLKGEEIGGSVPAHHERISMVVANRAAGTLATASDDGTLRIWAADGRPIGEPLRGHVGRVGAVDVSPSGDALASGGEDGTIRIWRAGNWRAWLRTSATRLAYHPIAQEGREAADVCRPRDWLA